MNDETQQCGNCKHMKCEPASPANIGNNGKECRGGPPAMTWTPGGILIRYTPVIPTMSPCGLWEEIIDSDGGEVLNLHVN